MAAIVSLFSLTNSVNSRLQQAWFAKRLASAEVKAPIFILGHWRSGTTLLHELLANDERYATPTTIQCFAPHLFMIYGPFIQNWLNFFMPRNRPMDNMTMGWAKPQEDEFAVCSMGGQSPYRRMAFPLNPLEENDFLDLNSVSPEDREAWLDTLEQFMKMVTVQVEKPLILKSPTHTGRVGELAERFPDARFIHIARNPYDIFASTVRLWQTMDEVQAFQFPKQFDYRPYVFDCFERMYAAYERGVQTLPPDRICHTRYEDLVADPHAELKRIYDTIGLDDFYRIESGLNAYAEKTKDFKPNRHRLDDETRAEIQRRWKPYFEAHGYPLEAPESS